jgi:hypothetical protein
LSTDEVMSTLIHGPSKSGKSSLSFTGPFPLCALDAEGSTKFIKTAGFGAEKKIKKITWNPLRESAPRYDGTWDVAVVNVPDWITMKTAKDRLQVEPHDFQSLSLDSVTEIQRKCKANMGKVTSMQQQDWGILLNEMDLLIRGFRDLLLLDNSLRAVTFIAETVYKNDRWVPNMQGAIATSMPYWVDICGYMNQSVDETGKYQTNLLVKNHPKYEAGERVQGRLPDVIANPNLSDILAAIYA